MELRSYYEKINRLEQTIAEPFPIVISVAGDSGRNAGSATEVTRRRAAQLVVDGKARLALPEEAEEFRKKAEETRRRVQQEAAAARGQYHLLSDADLRSLRGGPKGKG